MLLVVAHFYISTQGSTNSQSKKDLRPNPSPPLHTYALALQKGILKPKEFSASAHTANLEHLEFKAPDSQAYPQDDLRQVISLVSVSGSVTMTGVDRMIPAFSQF